MIKKALTLCIITTVCLLTSCSSKITKGEVYKKEFIAAHSDMLVIPITHFGGNISYTTMMPIIRCYPDQWVVYIRKYNEDEKDWDTADYYISKECYDNISIGDYFEFDSDTMKSEPTYTDKERDSNGN